MFFLPHEPRFTGQASKGSPICPTKMVRMEDRIGVYDRAMLAKQWSCWYVGYGLRLTRNLMLLHVKLLAEIPNIVQQLTKNTHTIVNSKFVYESWINFDSSTFSFFRLLRNKANTSSIGTKDNREYIHSFYFKSIHSSTASMINPYTLCFKTKDTGM